MEVKIIVFFIIAIICSAQAQNNTATSDQTGRNNETFQQQIGNNNTIRFEQEGNENKFIATQNGFNNRIFTTAKNGYNPSDKNQVTASQNGDENLSDIRIISDGNENIISHGQNGNKHSFVLELNERSDVNQIQIMQTNGELNQGNFLLNGSADYNEIIINQDGTSNLISGHIDGGVFGHGDENLITAEQIGQTNKIGTSLNARDGILIKGNENCVIILQNGQNHQSLNRQVGNNNKIDVKQMNY